MAKRNGRAGGKREKILAAAKDILSKRGKEVSMSDISAALGLEASGIYYYFKSVPEIIDDILEDEYHDFSMNEARIRQTDGDPAAAVKEMMLMLCEFYYDNLEILRIILAQVYPPLAEPDYEDPSIAVNRFLATYRQANENILSTIVRAQELGALTSDYPSSLILQTMRGYIFGLSSAWRERKPERSTIPGLVDRFLSMYRP